MNLNFWPKMYYSGGGGGGGGSGGGGGGAAGGGAGGGGGGYGGGAGAGGAGGSGGGAAGEQPPEEPTPVGAFRFNTDSAKLEYYDGNQWVIITTDSPDLHTGGTRGVCFKGNAPSNSTAIDFINVDTTGNAQDFGDKTNGREGSALGSRTRGIHALGFDGSNYVNTLEFITFASKGNTQNFGDLTFAGGQHATHSSATRGILAGGYIDRNDIQYFTMATTGNAVDFGDQTYNQRTAGGCGSQTRMLIGGGGYSSPTPNSAVNIIDFITISTTGNAADFGDRTISSAPYYGGGNAVRGIWMGGQNPSAVNTIDYATISTLGNAVDFGDLVTAVYPDGYASSPTRVVNMGGLNSGGSAINTMEYIYTMTTGNSIDFGDAVTSGRGGGACSNGHGGLT